MFYFYFHFHFQTLCEDEVLSFSQMLWQNKELIDALYRLFDSKQISEVMANNNNNTSNNNNTYTHTDRDVAPW